MFAKFKTYIEESRQEFRRVNWPSWETTVRYTLFVIGLSLALSVFLGILDFGFLTILKQATLG
ncbi:MAG: preprotein translocase subunit SecE [bacterium]|nr:preprotein translocase subunit SecE [bacterium]